MKKSLILVFTFLLCLAFQNCRPVTFTSLDDPFSGPLVIGPHLNNGEGYGGKLVGNFVRFRPDFMCEGKSGPVAQIQATENLITVTESNELACLSSVSNLNSSEVDTSIFQKDIIGYKEGIFESFASTPDSIPANLVEVWCRDSKDKNGIETITHYNRNTQEAVTKIYYATEDSSGLQFQIQGDFPVSRLISMNRVTVRDEKDFELIVFRDQPSTEPGILKGSLKANLNGTIVSRETQCRLSGTLDPSLWPAKQIVDLSISSLKISDDQSLIAFAARLSEGGPSKLYLSSSHGSNKSQVSPPQAPGSVGVLNFEFSPQSDSLIFWGDVFTPNVFQLVKANLDGSNLIQLNETLTDRTQAQNTEIDFSADGTKVLYQDGSQEVGHPYADIEMFLRSVPISGGTPTLINTMTKVADVTIHDFAVSKFNKTVAYVFGFAHDIFLYLTDINGQSPKKFYRSDLPSGWASDPYTRIQVPDPGNYFIIKYSKPGALNEFSYFAINTTDLTSIKFPSNWEFHQLSPDGGQALLLTPLYPKKPNRMAKVFTMLSQNQIELNNINNPIFSSDSKSIFDSYKNAEGHLRLKQFVIESRSETEVCPQANGNLEAFKEIPSKSAVLLVLKTSLAVLEFWERHENGSCIKRNSLPVNQQSIEQIEFAPDQRSFIIKTQTRLPRGLHHELFFIPLNGQPPNQIDSSLHQQVKISKFQFLKDSKNILFVSDSIRKNTENAFIWKIPDLNAD